MSKMPTAPLASGDRPFDRLPLWAREEIETLRRRVVSLNTLIGEMSLGLGQHPLSYTDVRADGRVISLPRYAHLKANRDTRHALGIEPVGFGVTLRSEHGRIVIHSHADNAATVYHADF